MKSKFSINGSHGAQESYSYGNNHMGIDLSGGPTIAGGHGNFNTSSVGGGYTGGFKGGLGVGGSASFNINPSAGTFELTLSGAAVVKGEVTISYTLGKGISFSDIKLGIGAILGAYVDTPVGGIGAAADGHLGFTVKDGILHTGLSGKAQAGILTVDGTVEARLGYGADFGNLVDDPRNVTPSYGSGAIPANDDHRAGIPGGPDGWIQADPDYGPIAGGFGPTIHAGNEYNKLDELAHLASGRYGLNAYGEYVDLYPELSHDGPYDFPATNNGLGPYAGAPGRPGPLNHSHSLPELAGTGYIGPQSGNPITSRGVDALEGPEAFGGGNDHDPGDNRANGPTGGHVQGSQHPGNTNGTGHSGSRGGRGGYTPSAGGGHGDTSSLKGNSGRDTPPGDVSTHDPYHNGTGARPVVFDLSGNGIGKSTIFIGAGDDRLLQRAQQGSGDVI